MTAPLWTLPHHHRSPVWVEWWRSLIDAPDRQQVWPRMPNVSPFRLDGQDLYQLESEPEGMVPAQRLVRDKCVRESRAPPAHFPPSRERRLTEEDLEEIYRTLQDDLLPRNHISQATIDLGCLRHPSSIGHSQVSGVADLDSLWMNYCTGDVSGPLLGCYGRHAGANLGARGFLDYTYRRSELTDITQVRLTSPIIRLGQPYREVHVTCGHLIVELGRADPDPEELADFLPQIEGDEVLVTFHRRQQYSHYLWTKGQLAPLAPHALPSLEGVKCWVGEDGGLFPFTEEQLAAMRPQVIVQVDTESDYPGYEHHQFATAGPTLHLYVRQPRGKRVPTADH